MIHILHRISYNSNNILRFLKRSCLGTRLTGHHFGGDIWGLLIAPGFLQGPRKASRGQNTHEPCPSLAVLETSREFSRVLESLREAGIGASRVPV